MSKSRLQLASRMRGLYRRVADRLGVDPSYVSRVARGERKSPKIEASLNREVSILLAFAAPKSKVKKL
jgi:transcriptional regulator with XRE-family HTH domain